MSMKFETEPLPGIPDYIYQSKLAYDTVVDLYSGAKDARLLHIRPFIDADGEISHSLHYGEIELVEFGSRRTAHSALDRMLNVLASYK